MSPSSTTAGHQLQHLTFLELSDCGAPFTAWPASLRHASVSHCALDPADLCRATALTTLELFSCPKLPATLSCLVSLRRLELENMDGAGASLGALRWLTSLEKLSLLYCRPPHEWPPAGLPSLRELRLKQCELQELPTAMSSMVALEVLEVEGCSKCTFSDVDVLSKLTRLVRLTLRWCKRVQHVPCLPLLSHLIVDHTAVRQLPLLPCLSLLSMAHCNLEAIPAILPQLTTLRCLKLDYNPPLMGADLEVLCPLAPRLLTFHCGQLVVPTCFREARVKCIL
jgi:Leucine-rich repeat (LRR) protein